MSTNMNNRHGRLETGELHYSGSGRWYLISAEAIKENSFSQFQFENFNSSSTPGQTLQGADIPDFYCSPIPALFVLFTD